MPLSPEELAEIAKEAGATSDEQVRAMVGRVAKVSAVPASRPATAAQAKAAPAARMTPTAPAPTPPAARSAPLVPPQAPSAAAFTRMGDARREDVSTPATTISVALTRRGMAPDTARAQAATLADPKYEPYLRRELGNTGVNTTALSGPALYAAYAEHLDRAQRKEMEPGLADRALAAAMALPGRARAAYEDLATRHAPTRDYLGDLDARVEGRLGEARVQEAARVAQTRERIATSAYPSAPGTFTPGPSAMEQEIADAARVAPPKGVGLTVDRPAAPPWMASGDDPIVGGMPARPTAQPPGTADFRKSDRATEDEGATIGLRSAIKARTPPAMHERIDTLTLPELRDLWSRANG